MINRKAEVIPLLDRGMIYNSEEACLLLKICKKSLQTLRDQGQISFVKIGGKIIYTYDDIMEIISNNRRPRYA
jgi:predicted site-specific integrase-resolvase